MNLDREGLYRGLSNAAWGYLFLNFDLNLGTVSVTPRFVGWLLFVAAIRDLAQERRDLALLRPLVLLLLGWSLLDWLFAWAGRSLEGQILFLDLLTAAAGLYFHYQFLTDMAALAERYQDPEDNLDRRLRRRRTQYLVLVTVIQLTVTLAGNWRQAWQVWLTMGLAVAGCVVAVLIMAALFALRRYFMPGEQPQDDSSH